MEEKNYRYDAFISYRHGELDDFVAAKLHKKLETYSLPRHIAKQIGRKKLNRVFRDREELMSSSSLSQELEEALCDSKYLILIGSSRTSQSPWVMKEITTFKALNGPERILLLIIEGKVEEVIPDILRVHIRTYEENGELVTVEEKVEPLATDIRGANKKEVERKLEEEILRLIAPIAGCRYDDLKQRHKERRKKKLMGLALGCALLLGGFGAFNAWRVWQIGVQMREKLATQSRALADQSLRLLEKGDRMKAILVGKEALPKSLATPEKPIMDEALYALSEALYVYKYDFKLVPEKTLDYSRPLYFSKLSPKGKWAATLSEEGYIEIWDLETEELKSVVKKGNSYLRMDSFEFIDDKHYILSDEEGLKLTEVATNQLSWQIAGESYNKFYLSPDKKQILVVGDTVRLYDAEKQQAIGELVGLDIDSYREMQVTWNQDMSVLAIGQDGKVHIWDLINKRWLTTFESKYKILSGLVFIDERSLAVSSNDEYKDEMEYFYGNGRGNLSYMRIGVNGAEEVWQLDSSESMIEMLRVNPENPQQLVMTKGNVLETVDVTVGKVQYSLAQSSTIMNYCLLGNHLALCGMRDGSVRTLMLDVGGLYDSASFNHSSGITDLNYAGGRIVITTGEDKKGHIYKDMSGSPKATLEGFEGSMEQGAYSKDGKWAYTISNQGDMAYIWHMDKQALVTSIPMEEYAGKAGFLEDNQSIYIFSARKGIEVWGLDGTFKEAFSNELAEEIYYKAPYFYLVSDTEVQIVKEDNLELYKTIETVDAVSLSIIDEGRFLTLDKAGQLSLVDIQTTKGQVLKEEGVLNCIANKDTIAVCLEDNSVELIDLKTGKITDVLKNDGLALSYFVFDEESKTLWLGYEDTTVWYYSLETKMREQLKENLPSPMTGIHFYKEENRMAITTEQNELLVYNLQNQKRLGYLKAIIAVNDKCDEFIRGDYEKLYVVPFYTAEMLVEEAQKQLVGRTLTEQEKEQYFIQE